MTERRQRARVQGGWAGGPAGRLAGKARLAGNDRGRGSSWLWRAGALSAAPQPPGSQGRERASGACQGPSVPASPVPAAPPR